MSGRVRVINTIRKRNALAAAEAAMEIADSMEVRGDLIRRMEAGEFSPAEMQGRLAAIKRNAKKNGLLTRDQVWRQS